MCLMYNTIVESHGMLYMVLITSCTVSSSSLTAPEPGILRIIAVQASLVGTQALPSYWLHEAVARGDLKVKEPLQLAFHPCWAALPGTRSSLALILA
jgi:hypothetical protein